MQDLEAVLRVDRTLCGVALKIDFLLAVTPVDVPEQWKKFHAGGYRIPPSFTYREPSPEIPDLRRSIDELDLKAILDDRLRLLLHHKRQELVHQLDCLEFRNTPRFLEASLALYGGVDPDLVELANRILANEGSFRKLPPGGKVSRLGSRAFARRANIELQRYRAVHPELASKVQVLDEVPGIMAFEGDLLIGRDLALPSTRVEALIQHEIGTHVLTFANGGAHPIRLLQVGLPGYEETQEALAVFSEYAVGGLTGARLGQLAARVVAVDALLRKAEFTEVFTLLRGRYRVSPRAAFQMVARVFRSGGLTKDAIYLRGIIGLLDYLAGGGELEPLFLGKLPLSSVPLLPHLESLGLIRAVPLRPRWVDEPGAQPKIKAARNGLSVVDLTNEEAA